MSLLDSLNIGSQPGQVPWWQVLAMNLPKVAGAALSAAGPGTGGGMLGAGLTGIGDVIGGLSQAGAQHQSNQRLGALLGKSLPPPQAATEAGKEGIDIGQYFDLFKKMQPDPKELVEAVSPSGQNMFVPRAAGPLPQGAQFGDLYKQDKQQNFEIDRTKYVQSSEDARAQANRALHEQQHQEDLVQRARLTGDEIGAANARAAAGRAQQTALKLLEIANRPKPQSELDKYLGKPAAEGFNLIDPTTNQQLGPEAGAITNQQAFELNKQGKVALVPKGKQTADWATANEALQGIEQIRQAGAAILPKAGPPSIGRLSEEYQYHWKGSPEAAAYRQSLANLLKATKTLVGTRMNQKDLAVAMDTAENAGTQEQLNAALDSLKPQLENVRASQYKFGQPGGGKVSNAIAAPAAPLTPDLQKLLDKHRK